MKKLLKNTLRGRCTYFFFRFSTEKIPSHNTVYAVHSLHFALLYFTPLRSAKHRIYWNVKSARSLTSLRSVLSLLGFKTMSRGCSSRCCLHSVRSAHGLQTTAGYTKFPCKESFAMLHFLYCGNFVSSAGHCAKCRPAPFRRMGGVPPQFRSM